MFFFFKFSLLYFWDVFNKTIIPLALVGYDMIIAKTRRYAFRWLSTILYPTRACGIIVKCSVGKKMATGTFTHSSKRKKIFTTFIKMYRKVSKIFKPRLHNVQGQNGQIL